MSSACRNLFRTATLLIALLGAVGWAGAAAPGARILRVAADPNNLPFSNDRLEGFENKIVTLLARELGADVEYFWRAQRRGFFREAFGEGRCDLVAGVPRGFDAVLTSIPYYESGYVMVSRRERGPAPRSLDDPALRVLRLGVPLIGDDAANPPPAHALAARGLVENVRGFSVYGDYRQPNPPARLIDAVVAGEIDVAVAWGPLAGFFARQHGAGLVVSALPRVDPLTRQPFAFAICLGVRRDAAELCDELNAVLVRKRDAIDAILAEYGVPRLDPPALDP